MPLTLVYAGATVVMGFSGVTQPEHRSFALLMFGIGLAATSREFLSWRQLRAGR